MNRRKFLASLGIGAPAAVVAAKMGAFEAARKYFFAPKGGWRYDGTWSGLSIAKFPGALRTPHINLSVQGPLFVRLPVYDADGKLTEFMSAPTPVRMVYL